MTSKPLRITSVIDTGELRLTRLERLVQWLGGPDPVNQACDRLNFGMGFVSLGYIITWTALFGPIGMFSITTGWTPARITVVSYLWVPLMAFQVFTGCLRYGSLSLLSKVAQRNMEVARQEFHDVLDRAVQNALDGLPKEDAARPPTIN